MHIFKTISVIAICILMYTRQFYVNVFSIERSIISGIFLVAQAVIFAYTFFRLRDGTWRTFLIIYSSLLTSTLILYFALNIIDVAQFSHALSNYLFSLLFVYFGHLIANTAYLHQYRIAVLCIFAMTALFSISEFIGVPFSYLENENWLHQRTFSGLFRITGGFNTQISCGLFFLSVAILSYDGFFGKKNSLLSITTLSLSISLIVLTFSRVYIVAILFLFATIIFNVIKNASWIYKLVFISITVIILLVTFTSLDEYIQLSDILLSKDDNSTESTNNRIEYARNFINWTIGSGKIFYGYGPGTQTGPGDEYYKIVGDGYWLSVILEFGLLPGSLMILFQIIFFYRLLKKASTDQHAINRFLLFFLSFMLFFPSIVNSAIADLSVRLFTFMTFGYLVSRIKAENIY